MTLLSCRYEPVTSFMPASTPRDGDVLRLHSCESTATSSIPKLAGVVDGSSIPLMPSDRGPISQGLRSGKFVPVALTLDMTRSSKARRMDGIQRRFNGRTKVLGPRVLAGLKKILRLVYTTSITDQRLSKRANIDVRWYLGNRQTSFQLEIRSHGWNCNCSFRTSSSILNRNDIG